MRKLIKPPTRMGDHLQSEFVSGLEDIGALKILNKNVGISMVFPMQA